jgi:hypothetical protein
MRVKQFKGLWQLLNVPLRVINYILGEKLVVFFIEFKKAPLGLHS